MGITQPADAAWMARALDQARGAAERGEVPVGAVLVRGEALVAEAGNSPVAANDATAHAEILVLRAAGRKLGNYRLPGTTLYVTLEPCAMCAGALVHARVDRLVYGAADSRAGAAGSIMDVTRHPQLNHRLEVTGGVLAQDSQSLLQAFFRARR
jgi:tRNA(adenine34) deaminase